MSKRTDQLLQQWRGIDETRARQRGHGFRVCWTWDGRNHGSDYFVTEAEAEEKVAQMVRENEIKIPPDYFERNAALKQMTITVEQREGGLWVAGPARTCVVGVLYADPGP